MVVLFFGLSLAHSPTQCNRIMFILFRGYLSSISTLLGAALFAAHFALVKYNNGNKVKIIGETMDETAAAVVTTLTTTINTGTRRTHIQNEIVYK